MRNVTLNLANYEPLTKWQPVVGDFIIHHGIIRTRWYGIVTFIDHKGVLSIVKSGLPYLLFTMPQTKIEKSTVKIDAHSIVSSAAGKYAVLRDGPNGMWYV